MPAPDPSSNVIQFPQQAPQDNQLLPSQQQGLQPRVKQNPKNEIVQLQSEIEREISSDAPEIAKGIFGDNADHPDMRSTSNANLDAMYLERFTNAMPEDRAWLQAEARRDPEQFLKVAERINVRLPPPTPPAQPEPAPQLPVPPPDLSQAPQPLNGQMAAVPPVPGAMVAPPMPPTPVPSLPAGLAPGGPAAMPPGAIPPQILGPDGQPLPPSGAM